MSTGAHPTPKRSTFLELDLPSRRQLVAEWRFGRSAAEVASTIQRGSQASENVVLLPGDAWNLKPIGPSELIKDNLHDAFLAPDLELAPGFVRQNMYRAPADLPDSGVSGVQASGGPAFVKHVEAGGSWQTGLSADAAAFPPPPDLQAIAPVDRIAASKTSFPANTPFGLAFMMGSDWHGKGTLLEFYFGGRAAVTPDEASGGECCLRLHADGTARLYEGTGDGQWEQRKEFRWGDPGGKVDAGLHALQIIPYSSSRIAFYMRGIESVLALQMPGSGMTLPFGFGAPGERSSALYEDTESQTGHAHTRTMTGAGIVRVSLERLQRLPTMLYRLKYPATGALCDCPFRLANPVPAGTSIFLDVDVNTPPGTEIVGILYDADTHAELGSGDSGDFLSNEGQSSYYARFVFTPSSDRSRSPVLLAYTVRHAGLYEEDQDIEPVTGGKILGVSMTGPDLTPDHETASLAVQDLLGELALLEERDRILCRLGVRDTDTGDVTYLLEGETAEVHSWVKGTPGKTTYPSQDWREYPSLRLVGKWRALMDSHVHDVENFNQDPDAPEDPQNNQKQRIPWKVTDIIRYCLRKAGAPPDEVSIPDLSFRLWATSALSADDYSMLPGTESGYARLAMKLAAEFLGAILLRDANAGDHGLWRLVFLPQPPYEGLTNFLHEFVVKRGPEHEGKAAAAAGTYGAAATWIEKESFHTWVRAPEATVVIVQGLTADGKQRLVSRLENPNWNVRGHEDYIGHVLEYVRPVDPALPTQRACDWLARRIYDTAGHRQKWFSLVAPLRFLDDPSDPLQTHARPLRVGDLITINGDPALARSGNPDYHESDKKQMMHLEGILLPA